MILNDSAKRFRPSHYLSYSVLSKSSRLALLLLALTFENHGLNIVAVGVLEFA